MSGNWRSSSSGSSVSGVSGDSIRVTCVICSEQYKRLDNIYAGTCGHVFHWDCLARWLRESQRCPVCRSRSADYFKIYLAFDEPDQSENPAPSVEGANEVNNNNVSPRNSNDYDTLVYEAALYRDEIEYLNNRIELLTIYFTDTD